MEYTYDENSETWPFFALTLTSMVVVPLTISSALSLRNQNNDPEQPVEADLTFRKVYNPPNQQQIEQYRYQTSRKFYQRTRFWILAIGWLIIAILCLIITSTTVTDSGSSFDPYAILNVSRFASEKEIRSVYRKLSLIYHPDKVQNVDDETRANMEDMFVKINKAYKALTDEVTRENFLKYGHPDGPQAMSFGVAIPKWVIESRASPLVLVVYVSLLAVVLPVLVARWWNLSNSYTKGGIHTETASLFVEKIINEVNVSLVTHDRILNWLSEAKEYSQILPGKTPADVKALLLAHVNREVLSPKEEIAKLKVVAKAPELLAALLDIVCAFRHTEIAITVVQTNRYILHAVPLENGKLGPLLQLPGAELKAVRESGFTNLGKFLNSKIDYGKTLGINNEVELAAALSVGKMIPKLTVLKAYPKVIGETIVPPKSMAHIVLKVLIHPPHVKPPKDIPESKLQPADKSEENLTDPFKEVTEQPLLPHVVAPYFPELRRLSWAALIVFQKDDRIADRPAVIRNLDLANLQLSVDKFDGEHVTVGTFKIPMSELTPDVGVYSLRVELICSSYFGCDASVPLDLKVEEPEEQEEEEEDVYQIPEPEQDSIAGALNAMKEGVPVDEDYADEFSDLDTDTENEGDN